MKQAIVWLLHDALSIEVHGIRYVPDWNAVEAIGTVTTAVIGVAAIWYSIKMLHRQLRHQTDNEAKKLEEQLLLRVMELADTPYEASKEYVADIVLWRLTDGPRKNPEFLSQAARKSLESHRLLSTATASALSVLRRSRPRRFPRGIRDHALEQYDDLVQKLLAANAQMLQYSARDWTKLDLPAFENEVGANAFEISNALRRVTADLLARMYSDAPEWIPFQFAQRTTTPDSTGRIAFDFADDPPLGTKG